VLEARSKASTKIALMSGTVSVTRRLPGIGASPLNAPSGPGLRQPGGRRGIFRAEVRQLLDEVDQVVAGGVERHGAQVEVDAYPLHAALEPPRSRPIVPPGMRLSDRSSHFFSGSLEQRPPLDERSSRADKNGVELRRTGMLLPPEAERNWVQAVSPAIRLDGQLALSLISDGTAPELLSTGVSLLAASSLHGHLPETELRIREMLPGPARWGSLHGYRVGGWKAHKIPAEHLNKCNSPRVVETLYAGMTRLELVKAAEQRKADENAGTEVLHGLQTSAQLFDAIKFF
jgi:hypothetical protein